jgi:hypothetical protein
MITSYSTSRRPTPVQRATGYAEKAVANRYVAYALIAALQLRVIWNIWKYADLTADDTSFYFQDAVSWAHGLHENLVYYPLYDAFWGTILAIVHDVYAATIIQRVAIILAATLLVLALMRALLGPALGLLIAAWWAIVPANYDVLYEVHLFGVLPLLIVALVVAYAPNRRGLGIAIAILLASSVLIRSELIAAAAILAVAVMAYEVRERRKGQRVPRWSYVRAYVVPLAMACLLIGGAYARSHVQGNSALTQLKEKEQVNFCESYAVSYQQRHPTRFVGNPFSECSPLVQHDFNLRMPTLFQAAAANPRAVAGFAAWNAQLFPGGLQVALFGATAFENDPGFRSVSEDSTYALLLSAVLLISIIAGLAIAGREGKLTLHRASKRTLWLVITFGSIAVATVLVVLTTRPWAEYMYGLTICVLVLMGVSISTLLRPLGGTRILASVALGTVLVLIATLPSIYSSGPRPIYEGVRHLRPVQGQLQRPGSVLVAGNIYNDLCNYLAYSYQDICTPMYWQALRSQVTTRTSVGQVLDRVHATAVYADAGMLADPIIAGLVAAPRVYGWKQIAQGSGPSGPWRVLIRVSQPS